MLFFSGIVNAKKLSVDTFFRPQTCISSCLEQLTSPKKYLKTLNYSKIVLEINVSDFELELLKGC